MSILRQRISDPVFKKKFIESVTREDKHFSKEEENAYFTKMDSVKELIRKNKKKFLIVNK